MSFEDIISKIRDRISQDSGILKELYAVQASHDKNFVRLESEARLVEQSIALLQDVAKATRHGSISTLKRIVDSALEDIFFDRSYEFQIDFDVKRGSSTVSFGVMENGNTFSLSECGGGLVDVVSVALRVAYLVLYKPKGRQVLIFDEPFRFLSAEYLPYAAAFLKKISIELGVKLVIVTHSTELSGVADTVYTTTKADGICSVKLMGED